jgi:hypothetical protein
MKYGIEKFEACDVQDSSLLDIDYSLCLLYYFVPTMYFVFGVHHKAQKRYKFIRAKL